MRVVLDKLHIQALELDVDVINLLLHIHCLFTGDTAALGRWLLLDLLTHGLEVRCESILTACM